MGAGGGVEGVARRQKSKGAVQGGGLLVEVGGLDDNLAYKGRIPMRMDLGHPEGCVGSLHIIRLVIIN